MALQDFSSHSYNNLILRVLFKTLRDFPQFFQTNSKHFLKILLWDMFKAYQESLWLVLNPTKHIPACIRIRKTPDTCKTFQDQSSSQDFLSSFSCFFLFCSGSLHLSWVHHFLRYPFQHPGIFDSYASHADPTQWSNQELWNSIAETR